MIKYILIIILLVLPYNTFAENWKIVGNWIVAKDESIDGACYIKITYDNGLELRFGYNSKEKSIMHLVISSYKWVEVINGNMYDISLVFDRYPPWNVKGMGIVAERSKGVLIQIEQSELAAEFALRRGLAVYVNGVFISSLSLQGSKDAVNELITCQETASPVSPNNPLPMEQRQLEKSLGTSL